MSMVVPRVWMPVYFVMLVFPLPLVASNIPGQWLDQHFDDLVQLYEQLHEHPELSFREVETAKRIADELEAVGARVTKRIGGHGVVGVLENGDGKRLLIRCELDALPIAEDTGLPYASKTQVEDATGSGMVGVMHACGHDVHMTALISVARFLSEHRKLWSGKILFVAQPAEEPAAGAKAMLNDGLYERFGKPDYALALHVAADLAVGKIRYCPGYATVGSDGVDITVRGVGGHGAKPHETIDPIVQASHLVLAMQTIVSREIDPLETAVITVGAIHGGTRHNVIPEECHLQVSTRFCSEEVRVKLCRAIEMRARGIAEAMGAPAPEIRSFRVTDPIYNDPELVEQLLPIFVRVVGQNNVIEGTREMGSEDFGMFAQDGVKAFAFLLGSVTKDQLASQDFPCPLHSPQYHPDIRPTLRIGIRSMSEAAIHLLPSTDKASKSP